jgi:hypothetical protein
MAVLSISSPAGLMIWAFVKEGFFDIRSWSLSIRVYLSQYVPENRGHIWPHSRYGETFGVAAFVIGVDDDANSGVVAVVILISFKLMQQSRGFHVRKMTMFSPICDSDLTQLLCFLCLTGSCGRRWDDSISSSFHRRIRCWDSSRTLVNTLWWTPIDNNNGWGLSPSS